MRGTRPRVVLVGPPGSGKTSVGRALGRRLGIGFRDTDDDVTTRAGMSVSAIFVERGEPYFREVERQAVADALKEHAGVLSVGGGAVMDPETRSLLAGQRVVHLEVGLAAAMRRLKMNRSRPLLVGNVRGRWQELAEERRPYYEEVAQLTLATDSLSASDVAALIAEDLETGRLDKEAR
jgi:shikimate kinase